MQKKCMMRFSVLLDYIALGSSMTLALIADLVLEQVRE